MSGDSNSRTTLRTTPSAGLRMDAVMCCFAALQGFARMTPEQVRSVGIEIAGMSGSKANDQMAEYELRTLPGRFTRLQLHCFEYVAFRQVAPESETSRQAALEGDIDFDLAKEYEEAKRIAIFTESVATGEIEEDGPLQTEQERTNEMRAAKDLIAELEEIAATGNYRLVALAVRFPDSIEFIVASQFDTAGRIEKLNKAIEGGGQPIGYVALGQDWKKGEVSGWLLTEHEGDGALQQYIAELVAIVGGTLAKGIELPARTG